MNKRSRQTDIPKKVKDEVWERDGKCCVLCGTPYAMPNAHFISRAQGGLGIPQNIVTLCKNCHYMYDQTTKREEIRKDLAEYLESQYPDWRETNLVYQK